MAQTWISESSILLLQTRPKFWKLKRTTLVKPKDDSVDVKNEVLKIDLKHCPSDLEIMEIFRQLKVNWKDANLVMDVWNIHYCMAKDDLNTWKFRVFNDMKYWIKVSHKRVLCHMWIRFCTIGTDKKFNDSLNLFTFLYFSLSCNTLRSHLFCNLSI